MDGEDYAKIKTYRSVCASSNADEHGSHLLQYCLLKSFPPLTRSDWVPALAW
jgi:hypothetical protein